MKPFKLSTVGVSEKEIQGAIHDYLRHIGALDWPVYNGAVYDPRTKGYRRTSKHYRPGVSDIHFSYKGQFGVIEVKAHGGKLSPEQKVFLNEIKTRGHIAIVAYSVDDVIGGLREFFAEKQSGEKSPERLQGS